jgi:ribosomal protein S18 acetylase RimI-like enzyme
MLKQSKKKRCAVTCAEWLLKNLSNLYTASTLLQYGLIKTRAWWDSCAKVPTWKASRDVLYGAAKSSNAKTTKCCGSLKWLRRDAARAAPNLKIFVYYGHAGMQVKPILRPEGPDDEQFLFQLYASTRESEFSTLGWSRAQLEPLLRMQFVAQRQWYETAFPQSEHQIATMDGMPVGRMIVKRAPDALILVDIALMTEHRGQGIGETLLRDLLQEGSRQGLPVRLQVLKNNPAARLYERLGFVRTGEDQLYWQMEKQPAPAS